MGEYTMTIREFYIYVMIAGAILGALFGLVPLIVGRRKNKKRLGLYGFLASIVGGAIAPLLGLIAAGVFFWLVVREKPAAEESAPARPDDGSGSATE